MAAAVTHEWINEWKLMNDGHWPLRFIITMIMYTIYFSFQPTTTKNCVSVIMMTPTLIIITKRLLKRDCKLIRLIHCIPVFLWNFFCSRVRFCSHVSASCSSTTNNTIFAQFSIELINVKATAIAVTSSSSC